MPKETNEYALRVLLVRIMRTILEAPYSYTKRTLADKYGLHSGLSTTGR